MSDPVTPPDLPVIPTAKMEEALIHFRRPFTASAIKWKVQVTGPKDAKDKTWATIVGYIDARLVSERLNMVVAGGWEEEPVAQLGTNLLRYKLTVLGQTHTDIGEGQGKSEGMKAKATDSDALKRVGVRFGIGVSLYAMPQLNLYVTPNEEVKGDKPTLARMKSGKAGYLKEQHERWLRDAYQQWLDDEGIDQFGQPLDHGDARTGSVGALIEGPIGGAVEEDDTPAGDTPEPLTDGEAQELRQRAAEAFGELSVVNPDRMARGRFDRMIADGDHSHAELEKVAVAVEQLRDTEKILAERRVKIVELVGEKKAKPIIDSAERRGSQQERIDSLDKAIAAAEDA